MKELQTLDDVFNKKIFRIPDYQRGYVWGRKQLVGFWEDWDCSKFCVNVKALNLSHHRSSAPSSRPAKKIAR